MNQKCISQNNKYLEEQSTRSLSFILHQSRNMLLMCDETYFTRMWCVFEIVARLRQDGNRPVNCSAPATAP